MSFPNENKIVALRRRVVKLEEGLDVTDSASLVAASLELGEALLDDGRVEEALEVYDRLVDRYGPSSDSILRQGVGWALYGKAEALFERGDAAEAQEVLAQIRHRFEGMQDLVLQGIVMTARVREAEVLFAEERFPEALALYDSIASSAPKGGDEEIVIQVPLATALGRKAGISSKLSRWDDALAIYAEFLRRFSDSRDEEIRYRLFGALEGKAYVLYKIGLYERAIDTADRLLHEFASGSPPSLRDGFGDAVLTRTLSLIALGRYEDALTSLDDLFNRYWDGARPGQRVLALRMAASLHFTLGRAEEALSLYTRALDVGAENIERFEPARDAYDRAQVLTTLNRLEEARLALLDVIVRYGEDSDESVRGTVALAREALLRIAM